MSKRSSSENRRHVVAVAKLLVKKQGEGEVTLAEPAKEVGSSVGYVRGVLEDDGGFVLNVAIRTGSGYYELPVSEYTIETTED